MPSQISAGKIHKMFLATYKNKKKIIKKAKAQIKMIKIYKHVSDKFVNLHNVTNFTSPNLINLT